MLFKASVAFLAAATIASAAASPVIEPVKPAAMTFSVALSGDAEKDIVPSSVGPGDMDGTGSVELTVDPTRRQICYDFTLSGLATPLMAHIHRGRSEQNGPSVVTLFTGPSGDLRNCLLWTEKHLSAIVANPANFYVNLSTTEFPDGALRGQLSA